MLKSAVIALAKLLPGRVRRSLVNVAFNSEREHFDYMAHRYANSPHMRHGLQELRDRGFFPRGIIDIGAYEGNWALMAERVWPDRPIVLFEPNEEKLARLNGLARSREWRINSSLLGENAGTQVTFHVMESGSSVYEEHSPLQRHAISRTVSRLDDELPKDFHPDFIKIDVQGYELEVLRGGLSTLSQAQAILIELSLIEINEGAPLLHEALTFMAEYGFVAFDFLELHRRPLDSALNQVDVLFIKADSPLRADKRHYA